MENDASSDVWWGDEKRSKSTCKRTARVRALVSVGVYVWVWDSHELGDQTKIASKWFVECENVFYICLAGLRGAPVCLCYVCIPVLLDVCSFSLFL